MNITPKLNLNKHPKDNLNLSLVNAQNVKVSNDESCISNEESIKENTFIRAYLDNYYDSSIQYKIVGIIPCNNELVIIVSRNNINKRADIFRYREATTTQVEAMISIYGDTLFPDGLIYNGGTIKGAFTYNVEGSLIISIAEYNVPNIKIPLKTINLGNFDDNTISSDVDLPDGLLSTSTEVVVPNVTNFKYVAGNAYKGWYYLFIRYKINTVDYTQWYSMGFPIYVDTLEEFQIVRYCYNRDTKLTTTGVWGVVAPSNPDDGFGAGCSDNFSNTVDIANQSFSIEMVLGGDYTKYQVGVVCASKSYIKSFRTSDITRKTIFEEFVLDNKSLIEHSSEEFIIDNYNYFNVKKVINYQNRLYISNYEETTPNSKSIDQSLIDNINSSLVISNIRDYGLVYDSSVINKDTIAYSNQYDTYRMTLIHMYMYLGVREDTIISVTDGTITKVGFANSFFVSSGNVTPAYAYIEYRELVSGSIVTTNFGKDLEKNVTITILNRENDNVIVFNTRKNAMNGGMIYTNTDTSFDSRKKYGCLIPGEVYNFFIHFVDKYGHATNGYKINNKTKWTAIDVFSTEMTVIPFNVKVGSDFIIYYAAIPINDDIIKLDTTYVLNIDNIKYYKNCNNTGSSPQVYNPITPGELFACNLYFKEYYTSYVDVKFLNYKWYQISYMTEGTSFQVYMNNNDERLFKVPLYESFKGGIEGSYGGLTDYKSYNAHILPRVVFSNIEIPEGYEGYYISYEKFESLQRVTGILTRNDFRSQDYIEGVDGGTDIARITANSAKADKMMFYSSMFDISDTIKLDYNIIRLEGVNIFKNKDIPDWDYFQRNDAFNFVHDCNKPQVSSYNKGPIRTYPIPEYKVAVADSSVDNRMGLGTTLLMEDAYNLFPNYNPILGDFNKIKLYRVTLLNSTRDIYMSNNKNLIRLSEVNYRNQFLPQDYKYDTGTITFGYNGHYSYDGVLIYENERTVFNSATNKVTRLMANTEYYKSEVPTGTPHTYENDIPFLAYCQFPVCGETFFESKSFKSPPQGIVYVVKTVAEVNQFATGSMVVPSNSIDLFENKQGSSDQFNTKTYTNFRNDLVSVEVFNKTVRRSNVIQDESRVNGWRNFPIEAYKNITENKGNITNLVGIGVILLVHTEHSLFMFDTDNTLKTVGQDIQLSQPDAFEVRYKEVFTSDLGFGGLQDLKSFVVDQFGYIFYSSDTNRFYQFDNNQLAIIDDDIVQWLNKYKPKNVRFANDKHNNRILIRMDYFIGDQTKTTIISYNYNTKSFITQHVYYFDEAYNTKNNLYLQCDNDHVGCSLHQFDLTGSSYGSYDNIKGSIGIPTISKSKISIIVNDNFDKVKFLEYLTYKLTKYVNDSALDFTNSPVEEYIVPFSGNTISVYNNMINTGVLDITVNNEAVKNAFAQFDKPYWDLGVWNYSYLRNNITQLNNGVPASDMSRLFGNYFVIEFVFNNEDGKRVEFEELNYSISKL